MKTRPGVMMGAASTLAALSLSGCLTAGPNPEDPYEGFNRQMFAFNDDVDQAVFEPVARGYRAVTNEPVRQGVRNFLDNLGEPITFANEVLQGQIPEAATTVGRFVINTTIGIAGVFNPAGAMGIERTEEDFGQTLGVWGVGPGPYLVLPIVGSTTPRDGIGWGVDRAFQPLNYAEFEGDDAFRTARIAMSAISGREGALEIVDDLRATQVDPYTTARRFYVRNRAALVGNDAPQPEETEKVPDYELDF